MQPRDILTVHSPSMDQSHYTSAAPQEIAGAMSLTGVWLYIPSPYWPEASPLAVRGNIETIVLCSHFEGGRERGGERAGIYTAIHRFTAHQAEKIYTPTEERDSNTF